MDVFALPDGAEFAVGLSLNAFRQKLALAVAKARAAKHGLPFERSFKKDAIPGWRTLEHQPTAESWEAWENLTNDVLAWRMRVTGRPAVDVIDAVLAAIAESFMRIQGYKDFWIARQHSLAGVNKRDCDAIMELVRQRAWVSADAPRAEERALAPRVAHERRPLPTLSALFKPQGLDEDVDEEDDDLDEQDVELVVDEEQLPEETAAE
ncbi:MAG TPA: hypothetical protein VM694_41995, partial [Polyangium sp.]|nr:hypothetical protein [Polyangium sp.]